MDPEDKRLLEQQRDLLVEELSRAMTARPGSPEIDRLFRMLGVVTWQMATLDGPAPRHIREAWRQLVADLRNRRPS